MPKIAVQNPSFIFQDAYANFNGYNLAFLQLYADAIYLTCPWHYLRYRRRLKELGLGHLKCIFSIGTLNHYADMLMHFGGEPHIPYHAPPKRFSGLKIWHALDYVFMANKAAHALQEGGVSYLMGYTSHDVHCDFFRKYYSRFIDRVIPVPFGFSGRFNNTTPFAKREKKCIALGAVNPVNDPLCKPGVLDEYISFYSTHMWTHGFRRQIAENHAKLPPFVESRLPVFPETKNPIYDAVAELNRHLFFINDEGLMNFPPARTYEGIACGSIMVASENKIWQELGFIEGVNYISFQKGNFKDFLEQLRSRMENEDKLKDMQQQSLLLAKEYTHAKVAKRLYEQIITLRLWT
jgi:hypothetical protein